MDSNTAKHPFVGMKVLVTTQSWFFGKDGVQYTAIYGTLRSVYSATDIGIRPGAGNANWYVRIGDMNIAGCQILYMEQCDSVNLGDCNEETSVNGDLKKYTRSTRIYQADEQEDQTPSN